MRRPQLRKQRTGRLAPIAALALSLVFAAAAIGEAQAENWLKTGDKTCMDIDSIRIVNDSQRHTLVAFVLELNCDPSYKTHLRQVRAVKRDDCPGIMAGDKPAMIAIYGPGVDISKAAPPITVEGDSVGRGMAVIACHRKGAPDGLVVFENEMMQDTAVVYVDGAEACRLDAPLGDNGIMGLLNNDCEVDLRRFGSDPERRHAVRIVAGGREVNDTVSVSDCHWNWQGTKVFEISDERVHFDCM